MRARFFAVAVATAITSLLSKPCSQLEITQELQSQDLMPYGGFYDSEMSLLAQTEAETETSALAETVKDALPFMIKQPSWKKHLTKIMKTQ